MWGSSHMLPSLCGLAALAALAARVEALDLLPMRANHFADASGLIKRQAEDGGNSLDLLDYETFYWGGQGADDLIYANLTIYFKEDFEAVLGMERFDGLLQSVTCGQPLILQFKDQTTYSQATDIWTWVNDDDANSFVLVSHANMCGDGEDRQPYVVKSLDFDDAHFKVMLQAEPKEWEDVATNYTFHLGFTPSMDSNATLARRDSQSKAEGLAARDAQAGADHEARSLSTDGLDDDELDRRDTDFAMSLASNFNRNLFSQKVSGVDLSVDCTRCGTTGRLLVDFDVDWGFKPKVSMKVNPQDVAAFLQLTLSASGKLAKAYRWEKSLVSIPIQGINIGKVGKIGAFLDIEVGFGLDEWSGSVETSFGAKMALSNAAVVEFDVFNPGNGRFSGWNPALTALPFSLGARVSGSAQLYAQPSVSLSAVALKKGIEMSLDLRMPYIEIDFDAVSNSAGVCGTKKTVGVDLDASAGVDLSVQIAKAGEEANPLWERTLFNQEWPLFSKCYAFGPNNAKGSGSPPPAKKPPKKVKTKAPKPKPTPKPKPKDPPAKNLKPKPPKTKAKGKPKPKPKSKKPAPKPKPTLKPTPTKGAGEKEKEVKTTPKPKPKPTPTSKAKPTSEAKPTDKSSSQAKRPSSDASVSNTGSATKPTNSVSATKSNTATDRDIGTSSTASLPPSTTFDTSTISVSKGSSSSTTSTTSACPSAICGACAAPDPDELLDDDVDDGTLDKRDGVKEVTFDCDGIRKLLRTGTYPQLSGFNEHNPSAFPVSPWFQPQAPDNLISYTMTSLPNKPRNVNCYETEHVYEAGWIVQFLLSLRQPGKWTCADLEHIFLTEKAGPPSRTIWAEELLARLGSRQNPGLLTMLSPPRVNSRKNNIYTKGNIISKQAWKKQGGEGKAGLIAEVARAMHYMADRKIGEIMRDTAVSVEDALLLLGRDMLANEGELAGKFGAQAETFLVEAHRTWLKEHLRLGNERAWARLPQWASQAATALRQQNGPQAYITYLSGLTKANVEREVPGFAWDVWL